MDTSYDLSAQRCLLGFNKCLTSAIQRCVSVSELADSDNSGFLSTASDILNANCFVVERIRCTTTSNGIVTELPFSFCFKELPRQPGFWSNRTCRLRLGPSPSFLIEHHDRFHTFDKIKVLFFTLCVTYLLPVDLTSRNPQISVSRALILSEQTKQIDAESFEHTYCRWRLRDLFLTILEKIVTMVS